MEFPRFFFISSADLLDILSKGNRPKEVNGGKYNHFTIPTLSFVKENMHWEKLTTVLLIIRTLFYRISQVAVHLSKLFDNMSDLDFSNGEELDNPKCAVGMYSKEREYVPFLAQCRCEGPVRLKHH